MSSPIHMLILVLPIVLLILLGLVIWWYIRGANARKDELARHEAHTLRESARAEHEATIAGQQAYATQTEQRHAVADQAAQEARAAQEAAEREAQEARARAAAAAAAAEQAKAEAASASADVDDAGHEVRDAHARLEETREAYAADLHRADVIDPDVEVDEEAHSLARGEGFGDDVTEHVPATGALAGGALAAGAAGAAGAAAAPDDAVADDVADAPDEGAAHDVHGGADEVGDADEVDELPGNGADEASGDVVDVFPSEGASSAAAPDDDAEVVDVFDEGHDEVEGQEEAVVAEPAHEESSAAPSLEESTHEDTWTDAEPATEQTDESSLDQTWAEADEAAAASPAAEDGDSGDWQYEEARDGQGSADDRTQHVDEAAWGRRISDLDEVADGGFGVGSAAPIAGGAQPLGHPVQAYRDTMTFRTEDDPGYDSCEPDVWFYDADSALRAGFTPAQHG